MRQGCGGFISDAAGSSSMNHYEQMEKFVVPGTDPELLSLGWCKEPTLKITCTTFLLVNFRTFVILCCCCCAAEARPLLCVRYSAIFAAPEHTLTATLAKQATMAPDTLSVLHNPKGITKKKGFSFAHNTPFSFAQIHPPSSRIPTQ